MEELETPTNNNGGATRSSTPDLQNPNDDKTTFPHELNEFSDDIDSSCSTPYVSAPSSPGRGSPLGGFFYSAPASPMHFVLSSCPSSPSTVSESSVSGSFEFEFSARFSKNGTASAGWMTSADELFLNGQIRPMKLSTHLQRPQVLEPLLDLDEAAVDDDNEKITRGRDVNFRGQSLRRRTRSMSPLRSASFERCKSEEANETKETGLSFDDAESKQNETALSETTPSVSASSSAGRSSKKWVFLKDFLYRSKSEGRNNGHKFWSSISFSQVKDRKLPTSSESVASSKDKSATEAASSVETKKSGREANKKAVAGKVSNRVGKRRATRSAHELHYTANRAQAEEMRKKTFLPYRQGLFVCLGFSSKSYGAMSGFARALNPVPSRALQVLGP
ncbi:hypothetical protein F0562_020015 [Nyssa sinensis]|uniref:Uncharacterized protein n=1 Tax=Nyssa sinensis TaxID=561372 RepID=A0A5J5BVD6_9ASTE|nr:hypothetical protein F0562_020015 [Nyssa sinensis]